MQHAKGKVWLVGAGPGDAGLLTLKGKQVLKGADIVVYDALVGSGILCMIPESAERIDVGKRSGHHTMPQEEISRLLFEEAKKGKNVVRLKGGDPFVFGRGGEELELLAAEEIPFEIVPGVTSAFAVPAYNGIPATHRDYCSSVHVITGHKRKDAALDIDFEALVRTKGTLIFLMGIAALPDICRGLLKAGIKETLPAAVLECGTTSAQHKILATVGTLEDICAEQTVKTPAIIVVGDVCALSDTFSWYENLPLFGVRVVVTRPQERSFTLSDRLRRLGAEVIELPAIRLQPTTDTKQTDDCLKTLEASRYDWLIFTSPGGVNIFMEKLLQKHDVRILSGVKIAAIGPGSAHALLRYGLRADFVPSVYDGETLGRELAEKLLPGAHIFIARSSIGNPQLTEELSQVEGIQITDLATYDTLPAKPVLADERQLFQTDEPVYVTFTSASAVRGFVSRMGDMDFSKVKAFCLGKQTCAQADVFRMQTATAKEATMESLTKCIVEYHKKVNIPAKDCCSGHS